LNSSKLESMDERLRVDQRCINIEQEWYENKQILSDMLRDASKKIFIELLVTVNTTPQPHQRFKVALLEPISRGTAKPLGFPSLVTVLWRMKMVEIPSHPRKKLRLPINKAYIQANWTKELDNMQGPILEP